MRKFLSCFVLVFLASGLQFNIQSVFADEIQEMMERAPLIMKAAYDDDWQKVLKIAKKNPSSLKDTDEMGNTALHEAAAHAPDSVVIELLKLGADKNAKDFTSRETRPYYYARKNKKLSQKVRDMLR